MTASTTEETTTTPTITGISHIDLSVTDLDRSEVEQIPFEVARIGFERRPTTKSGKIELKSAYLAQKYDAALPRFQPLAEDEKTDADYPLALITPSSNCIWAAAMRSFPTDSPPHSHKTATGSSRFDRRAGRTR